MPKIKRGRFVEHISLWQHGIEQMAGVECQIIDESEDNYVTLYKLGKFESNALVPKEFVEVIGPEIESAPAVEKAKKVESKDVEKKPVVVKAEKTAKTEAKKISGSHNRVKNKQQGGSNKKNVGR